MVSDAVTEKGGPLIAPLPPTCLSPYHSYDKHYYTLGSKYESLMDVTTQGHGISVAFVLALQHTT